jgi:hypothetical protein
MKGYYKIFIGLTALLLTLACPSDKEEIDLIPSELIQASDLEYQGAFRMPDGETGSEVKSWAWGGFAMTYYPHGNPGGPNDGYTGSIFATGHAWEYQISEISIPVPVRSSDKNLSELNIAETIQGFQNILDVGHLEIPRVGLAYLSKQGEQSGDKLYFCWGAHFQEANDLTHGWMELDLHNPLTQKGWFIDCPHHVYNTNDYMFTIPAYWADEHTPGKLVATGRFRDGGWSGQGPALFAIGPWNQGNPPVFGTSLEFVTLLRYTSSEDYGEESYTMNAYHHSDEWSGAVWVTAGNKAAMVFVGTKGVGECWYGDEDGPCLDCEGDRGWWSTEFKGKFVFYDPSDFSSVAAGEIESWEPQPYTSLDVDEILFGITEKQQKYHLGAACCDQTNGILYVFEPGADGDKPLIHVWKIKT